MARKRKKNNDSNGMSDYSRTPDAPAFDTAGGSSTSGLSGLGPSDVTYTRRYEISQGVNLDPSSAGWFENLTVFNHNFFPAGSLGLGTSPVGNFFNRVIYQDYFQAFRRVAGRSAEAASNDAFREYMNLTFTLLWMYYEYVETESLVNSPDYGIPGIEYGFRRENTPELQNAITEVAHFLNGRSIPPHLHELAKFLGRRYSITELGNGAVLNLSFFRYGDLFSFADPGPGAVKATLMLAIVDSLVETENLNISSLMHATFPEWRLDVSNQGTGKVHYDKDFHNIWINLPINGRPTPSLGGQTGLFLPRSISGAPFAAYYVHEPSVLVGALSAVTIDDGSQATDQSTSGDWYPGIHLPANTQQDVDGTPLNFDTYSWLPSGSSPLIVQSEDGSRMGRVWSRIQNINGTDVSPATCLTDKAYYRRTPADMVADMHRFMEFAFHLDVVQGKTFRNPSFGARK